MTRGVSGVPRAVFAFTTGLSAFLLFLVQPLVGKAILPWFGGGPGVWTTAMLFFQLVLLLGYAYAHGLSARLSPRAQVAVHCAVLVAGLACLPIELDPAWKPAAGDEPVLRILGLLSLSVGVPYFALSTTGPLLQRWFGGLFPQRTPYGLYALSNAGSLLALLAYPTFVERALDVGDQSRAWSWAFLLFAVAAATCALGSLSMVPTNARAMLHEEPTESRRPGLGDRTLWFLLSLIPSWMLLAVTNQLCIDVASVPFLWVAPLALYLISFIVCFGTARLYRRGLFATLWVIATCALCVQLTDPTGGTLLRQVLIYLGALTVCVMLCHGELAARRPSLSHLTEFYLWISVGGAAGGVFVGVLSPRIFVDYSELHLGVVTCYCVVLAILIAERQQRDRWLRLLLALGLGGTLIGLSTALMVARGGDRLSGRIMDQSRNFYGVLRVTEVAGQRILTHGRIWHGIQRTEPGRGGELTLYHGAGSGIARLLSQRNEQDTPLRVGVVGLGIGTLAHFARPGDLYRFYELDPEVIRMAQTHFTFLRDSAARIELVEGDGRLSLEREVPQRYDVLAIDAFSSDSIPAHLLTLEAFAVYHRHVRDDGVLAVHVSNRYLDLLPVVLGAAERVRMSARIVRVAADYDRLISASTWVLLAKSPTQLTIGGEPTTAALKLWTDARSSLFEVLR